PGLDTARLLPAIDRRAAHPDLFGRVPWVAARPDQGLVLREQVSAFPTLRQLALAPPQRRAGVLACRFWRRPRRQFWCRPGALTGRLDLRCRLGCITLRHGARFLSERFNLGHLVCHSLV